MGYTKQELKDELLRCYEENGHTDSSTLNDKNNDYPTQMTYSNHFGSLTRAKESVGILGGHTRERVLSDVKDCYQKNGNVSISLLQSNNKFINPSTLYKHFDSIWMAIEKSDVNVEDVKVAKSNNRKKYTREQLIELLIECKDQFGNTKSRTINECDYLPSIQSYKTSFGSIKNARREAGISTDFKNSNKIRNIIDKIKSYDSNADAHVYVLNIEINGETAYYVGETTNLHSRLQTHYYQNNIQCWSNGEYGKILSPRDDTGKSNEFDILSVEYVIPMYQENGESKIEFRRRRKYKEHHEHLSVAIDMDTVEVYGGR